LYDLAGIQLPPGVDGMSLAKLLKHDGNWREGILLEGWPGRGDYSAVRTQNYVYAETEGDIPEFYDLQLDPFEMKNFATDPKYKDLVAQHQILLHQLEVPQPTPIP
jgi:arylsulfatase A-like enzyme